MLTDTHAHLYWDSFKEDFDEMIQRAIDAGVSTIINVGVDVEKSQEALRQAQGKLADIPNLSVYSTIGIHPHEALRLVFDSEGMNPQAQTRRAPLAQGKPSDVDISIKEDMEKLEEIYKSNPGKVVAVGECGLDYFFDPEFTPSSLTLDQIKILQKKLFQAHINLAKKLNLPLIVHCRDDRSKDPQNSECWNEVIEMTKDHFGIYHCYSGLLPTTNYLLQSTNFLISFAATITYPKNDYLREAVKLIPLDRIVLETDCPFLPPQSKRGQRNEPAAVKEIAELVANLKEISLEEVADQTTSNAKKVFNI